MIPRFEIKVVHAKVSVTWLEEVPAALVTHIESLLLDRVVDNPIIASSPADGARIMRHIASVELARLIDCTRLFRQNDKWIFVLG